jgi:hypothetical protein
VTHHGDFQADGFTVHYLLELDIIIFIILISIRTFLLLPNQLKHHLRLHSHENLLKLEPHRVSLLDPRKSHHYLFLPLLCLLVITCSTSCSIRLTL